MRIGERIDALLQLCAGEFSGARVLDDVRAISGGAADPEFAVRYARLLAAAGLVRLEDRTGATRTVTASKEV